MRQIQKCCVEARLGNKADGPLEGSRQHIHLERSQRILRVFKCQFQICRFRLQHAAGCVFVRASPAWFGVIMYS